MSSGLTIQSATYGTGSSTVDVTSAVSKKVKDGVLNFTVSPSAFGIDDPAPGQLKQVDIVYTINDGKKNEMMKKDNDLVWIDAPPQRLASGLQIVKAQYGYPGNWTDVTDALQNLMSSDGSINTKVGFKELGLPDPNPNKQKTLGVEYTINGAPSITNLKDGERFRLNAPALEDTSGPGGKSQAWSFIGVLVSNAFLFIGIFIQFMSGYVTADFSTYLFGGGDVFWYMFMFFGTILPAFGFIGLPFITFFIRLFRHTDIVPA
jgi:hypothetical protein